MRRSQGSSGSHGSSGGSYGSHGSNGSHGGSNGVSYNTPVDATPVISQPVYHSQPASCPGGTCFMSQTATPQPTVVARAQVVSHAMLVVNVPADAAVFLAGQRMTVEGQT